LRTAYRLNTPWILRIKKGGVTLIHNITQIIIESNIYSLDLCAFNLKFNGAENIFRNLDFKAQVKNDCYGEQHVCMHVSCSYEFSVHKSLECQNGNYMLWQIIKLKIVFCWRLTILPLSYTGEIKDGDIT